MLIVDAQVHIWSSGTPMAPHRQVSSYGADELLQGMGNAGVDAALIHPPSWDPRSHEIAIEAARTHPDQFAILGYLPPDQAQSRALIDHWKSQPGVLGLR
jgi:predicted TIM-barrel fold metal-dependent hydrolase